MNAENSTPTEISPTADLALRKHVERAVRPLPATEQRKLRIREELLTHLAGIYHSEREKLDESAAIAAACERFGSPAELQRELTASLPLTERMASVVERYERAQDRFWSRGSNESLLRYLARSVTWIALLTFLLTFGVVGAFSLIGGPPDDESTYMLLAKMFPLLVLGETSALLAALAIDHLTARQVGLRRWLILALHGIGWSALLTTATFGFWWWISGQPFSAAQATRVSLSIVAAVCFVIIAVAFACDHTRRRKATYDAWRLLPIDE